jgi:hypothetical protein
MVNGKKRWPSVTIKAHHLGTKEESTLEDPQPSVMVFEGFK